METTEPGRAFVHLPGTRAAPRRLLPWGDGISDTASDLLWSARCDDLTADEMVFLIPAVAQGLRVQSATAIELLDQPYKALRQSIRAFAKAIVRYRPQVEEDHAVDGFVRCAGIVALSPADIRDCIRQGLQEGRRGWPELAWGGREGERFEAVVVAIACCWWLDRALAGIRGAVRPTADVQDPVTPASLADVLMVSLMGRVNGAYFFPQYALAHELLSTGAWLGHLMAGRKAFMPQIVARCLIDYLGETGTVRSRPDNCTSILRAAADQAGGLKVLLRHASSVATNGSSPLVARPPLWRDASLLRHGDWNSEPMAHIRSRVRGHVWSKPACQQGRGGAVCT